MESKRLEVIYYRSKDNLYLNILPCRPSRMAETDYDFYICYDWDNSEEIVGFEWLDFSRYFNAIDDEGVIPDLEMRFDIEGTNLKRLTLKEVLRWAYRRYVLCLPEPEQ